MNEETEDRELVKSLTQGHPVARESWELKVGDGQFLQSLTWRKRG